jgi:hypothetical protein
MKSTDDGREFVRRFLAEADTEARPDWNTVGESAEQLRKGLHEFGQWARSATERSEDFWQHQQVAIRSRMPARSGSGFGASLQAWASVAALVMLGISLLTVADGPTPLPAPVAQVDADHELLLAIERDARSEVPAALQPAALLAQEINVGMQTHSVNSDSSKEKTHED